MQAGDPLGFDRSWASASGDGSMNQETSSDAETFRVGVAILGAGRSSRMGRPKMLLPWEGDTVIGHQIATWRSLNVAQIAVVHASDDLALVDELARHPAVDPIPNPDPNRGMMSSVMEAAKWEGWKRTLSHLVLSLGDQPHLTAQMLRELLLFARLHSRSICQPAFADEAHHPVILPRPVWAQLGDSLAPTFQHFLARHRHAFAWMLMNHVEQTRDLDTPEDYLFLSQYAHATST